MEDCLKVWDVNIATKEPSQSRRAGVMFFHEEGMYLEIFAIDKKFCLQYKGQNEQDERFNNYEIQEGTNLLRRGKLPVAGGLVLHRERDNGTIYLNDYPELILYFYRRRKE